MSAIEVLESKDYRSLKQLGPWSIRQMSQHGRISCKCLLLATPVFATVVAPGASWQPSDPREPEDLPSHKAKSQDAEREVWRVSKSDYALQRG